MTVPTTAPIVPMAHTGDPATLWFFILKFHQVPVILSWGLNTVSPPGWRPMTPTCQAPVCVRSVVPCFLWP